MFQTSDSNRLVSQWPLMHCGLTLACLMTLMPCDWLAGAQEANETQPAPKTSGDKFNSGYWIEIDADLSPLSGSTDAVTADRLVARLNQLASATTEGGRTTVLMRMQPGKNGIVTSFEDALKVARAIGQPELRSLRMVAFIDGEITGHRLLIALAAEQILISESGSIGNATETEGASDETVGLTYDAIARRRNLLPPAIVAAMLDRDSELAQITTVDGKQRIAEGADLKKARADAQVLSEDVLKQPGTQLRLSAKQLRDVRAVGGIVNSIEEAADVLDLADLVNADVGQIRDVPRGVLIQIDGSIAANRARRWRSNLAASLESSDVNTWLVEIDSSGGNLETSVSLASSFAIVQPPLQTVAGFIRGEARGDSAILAMACRPLMMSPDARLGGPGAEAIDGKDLERHHELIEQIAKETKRSPSLMKAMLNPELEVYRYTDRKTGRIRYATADEIAGDSFDSELGVKELGEKELGDNAVDLERWQRGEKIELNQGISVSEAIKLGLVEAEVVSLDEAARRIGLEAVPPTVVDRPLVRFVEKIGRSNGLMFLLLMIGFFTLSAEAGAPGLGVPGFISMLCFALYFWMKFLAGTAEWLELVAVVLGLTFIAIEIFIVPGVGVFGVGGLVLTVLGIVLMSQTFVIPQNSYQIEVLTRGIWVALGALVGLVGGFVAIRSMMPHVPILNEFVMESGDVEALDRQERLADYGYLAGQTGVATTMLRPAGKARFGDTIVGVVSDGSAVEAGDAVRVREVLGTRIVVEAVES